MTTRIANEIRAAETPIYCAGCMNQQPELQHVDFDAACDRGYGEGPLPVTMDDLILCENCVREGARLIGMEDTSLTAAHVRNLEAKADTLEKRLKQAERYADAMEMALDERPEKVHLDHRKKPRKQIEMEAA